MKAMVLTRPGHMECQEVPRPEVTPDSMIVRVESAAICNATDYRSYRADPTESRWPSVPCPVVLGHELCGVVEDVGSDIREWAVGDTLVPWGVSHGAYAQYCRVVPEEVAALRIPECVSASEAAALEPAMGAIRYLVAEDGAFLLKEGDRVMVAGLGPSGLFFLQYAALCGAKEIWAADHNEPRCEIARALGAHKVFSSVEDLTDAAEEEGAKMDALLDTTEADLHDAFARLTKPNGLIVPYGGGCDWDALSERLGDTPFRKGDGDTEEIRRVLPQMTEWLASGELQLGPIVSKRVPLRETDTYLEALQERPKYMVKVAVLPWQ